MSNSPKIFRRTRRGFRPNYFDNLSVKLLQHFNKQNNNHGFTLIELLVVIIIIGILSAIGLSSFLNLVAKAKEAEPTLKISGANKTQMNYYSENGKFSRNPADLELPAETENYVYSTFPFPLPPEISIIMGEPKDNQLRYVLGVVYIENDGTSYQRVCKAYPSEFLTLAFMLLGKNWNQADAQYCSGK